MNTTKLLYQLKNTYLSDDIHVALWTPCNKSQDLIFKKKILRDKLKPCSGKTMNKY